MPTVATEFSDPPLYEYILGQRRTQEITVALNMHVSTRLSSTKFETAIPNQG